MEAVCAEEVWKSYGKTVALQGASLTVEQGEILALLGANGSGKTTLTKTLVTLLVKDSGRIRILGYDIDSNPTQVRQLVGYVGQDTERSAYARLTVVENLMFFGRLRNMRPAEIRSRIEKLSYHFEFDEHLNKQFMHLSGGQKQTVVIMRALLHDPPVLFLDEPTKGLDPVIARRIRNYLKAYIKQEGKSLLLTSHIMNEVEEMADRVALIRKGKVLFTERPDTMKAALGPQDMIEIRSEGLPEATIQKILNLPSVVKQLHRKPEWTCFGVSDFFEGTSEILRVLKEDGLRLPIRHRQVTLEDAFIHHVGGLDESLER